jgi:hypothetical protein
MSHALFPSSSENVLAVALEIVPVEEEENDLDTLAIAGQIQSDIRQEVASFDGYNVSSTAGSQATRTIDPMMLITFVGASIAVNRELITSLFQMVSTIVEVLAKHGRIQEIEIFVGDKTVILHDVSKKTAMELVASIEEQHPGTTTTINPTTAVKLKAGISKKKRKNK